MIVFVVSFLFCDDCFLRCWDSQNPCGARWAGGLVCPLGDVATLKSDDGYFVILALDKAFRCFPGDFRVLVWCFPRVFLGLSRVAGSVLFRVGSCPLFGLVVAPLPCVFLFGPFWPCFSPALFVSCVLHLSL